MSIDRSLKSRAALLRHRSVLSRAERIGRLADEDRWNEEKDSVFGLPKVIHRRSTAGKKSKKEKEEISAEAATSATQEASGKSTPADK